MSADYDDVAYPSLPLQQTRPDQIAVQLLLRGASPADPATARVLEIGCSDAGNLAALAAYRPQARFLGVDRSAQAVARAQRHGLANLEVIQADLRHLDIGEFDYVIAHGVYSWIPNPDDLLSCLDRHLSARGVAYVSYNAMPGWGLRQMATSILRREAGADAAKARMFGEELLAQEPVSPAAQALHTALRIVLRKPDHVLHHDDLDPVARGFYIDEVVEAASHHGLHYTGEAHLADCVQGADADIVRSEVLHDYGVNRMFRSSLFVRYHVAAPQADRVRDLWVSAPVNARGGRTFELMRGVRAEVDEQLAGDLRRLGAAWPAAVPGQELTADPQAFLRLYSNWAIDLSCGPVPAVTAGSHPFVVEYMRTTALRGDLLATVRQESIRLEDERSRRAVSLMDGRHNRAAIAQTLRQGPGDRVRADLDALIEALGRKGLFLRPPAGSAG